MGPGQWQDAGRNAALLADRVLLVVTYRRTNLTTRQIGPLFGVSHSAAPPSHRHPRPAAGLGAGAQRPVEPVAIVNGTRFPPAITGVRATGTRRICRSPWTQAPVWSSPSGPQPGYRNGTIVYRTSGIEEKLNGRPVMAMRRLPRQPLR